MKFPYTLSTDYAELFRLIQDGAAIAGFVTTEKYIDDIAKIRKHTDGYYSISARGICYADLPTYWQEFPKAFPGSTEKEVFVNVCQSVNLRWIKP